MYVTCFNCQHTWNMQEGRLLAARLNFGLGSREHAFVCPSCSAKNILSEETFLTAYRSQTVIPVTGLPPGIPGEGLKSRAKIPGGNAPVNPVEGPGPDAPQLRGIVLARGVEARRDHNIWAEVMGGFSKGEQVTVFETWTDGESTWVQLGPERWVDIEQDGEPVIELIDE